MYLRHSLLVLLLVIPRRGTTASKTKITIYELAIHCPVVSKIAVSISALMSSVTSSLPALKTVTIFYFTDFIGEKDLIFFIFTSLKTLYTKVTCTCQYNPLKVWMKEVSAVGSLELDVSHQGSRSDNLQLLSAGTVRTQGRGGRGKEGRSREHSSWA